MTSHAHDVTRNVLLIPLQSTGLPSSHRPEQIAVWNRNRRPLAANRQPTIEDPDAFVAAFWKWWDELNPRWRIRDNGHLKIGGAGPWDALHKSGQNGFLSVLQVLYWWRSLLGVDSAEGSKDWNYAVIDVVWVLSEVLHSKVSAEKPDILNSERVHKRAHMGESDDDSQAASQGRRSKR